MSTLIIEQCPETGIGSIVRQGGAKVDLMPDEVSELRAQKGYLEAIRKVIAGVDGDFAATLTADELTQIAEEFSGGCCSCSGSCKA